MATILSTELKVYAGTTTSGTQVGNTITDSTSGGPEYIVIDYAHLGANLSPGEQYCAVARCTNDEQYTTDWTPPYAFKTLAYAEILSLSPSRGNLYGEIDLTYNSSVMSVAECGIMVSTNANGNNATRIPIDEQEIGQFEITTLNENTTYYCVPYVTDDTTDPSRLYVGAWEDAEIIRTSYKDPVVELSSTFSTTYNSITGNVTITTNDTLSGVTATITPTGGGTNQTVALTATTGLQPLSLVGGTTPLVGGGTLSLSPSTEYRITVTATNTSGGTGTDSKTATTASQSTETIEIRSVTNITPTSARVNLRYNNGGAVVNPDQQQ